jgi:hypothetical protein
VGRKGGSAVIKAVGNGEVEDKAHVDQIQIRSKHKTASY